MSATTSRPMTQSTKATLLGMVHKTGAHPAHAVRGQSPLTLCGLAIDGDYGTARGLIHADEFERIAKASVIAGACTDCVSIIDDWPTPEPAPAKPAKVSEAIITETGRTVDEVEGAYERCGQAHARVMALEDLRQALKPEVIRRLVETGAATSASAAEKLVERDEAYMAHRNTQYEAEIERWRAIGQTKVADLKAVLAGAIINA